MECFQKGAMEQKIARSVGTHDGGFHADEVTACALLALFDRIDPDKIVRTRDPKRLALCEYVCDVGGLYDPKAKLFDHHQAEYQGPLSSAGMVLLYLKEEGVLSAQEFDCFHFSLIKGIDDHDNGRAQQEPGVCSISHVIANFTPVAYAAESQEMNHAFREAFDFVLGHLRRLWRRYQYIQECKQIVAQAMEKGKEYLEFETPIPWLESFFQLQGERHPALYVIMPAGGHWKLRCIPPSYAERMQMRRPLPKAWAGLLDAPLKQVTGIPGAIFCHKGRFTSVWETKEDALRALHMALKEQNAHSL